MLYYEGGRKPAVSKAPAEKRCFEWLVEELKAPRAKLKEDYQAEAEAENRFGTGTLGGRAFDRAWAEAKKEPTTHKTWDKRGPVGSLSRVV